MDNICRTDEYRGYKIQWSYVDMPENPRTWDVASHMICWANRYTIGDDHNYSCPRDLLEELSVQNCTHEEVKDFLLNGKGDCRITFELLKGEDKEEHEEIGKLVLHDGYDECDAEYYCNSMEECIDYAVEESMCQYFTNQDLMELVEKHVLIRAISIYGHSGIRVWFGTPCDKWDSATIGYSYMTEEEALKEGATKENWREKAEEIMEAEMRVYNKYVSEDVYGFQIERPSDGEIIDACCGFYGEGDCDEQLKECFAIIDRDIEECNKHMVEMTSRHDSLVKAIKDILENNFVSEPSETVYESLKEMYREIFELENNY